MLVKKSSNSSLAEAGICIIVTGSNKHIKSEEVNSVTQSNYYMYTALLSVPSAVTSIV